jgi:hypothetical protein
VPLPGQFGSVWNFSKLRPEIGAAGEAVLVDTEFPGEAPH